MKWKDFLNPRSMLTPGVAGSIVMVIANTLWIEFMIPQKWSALTLSFLLIIPILIKFSCSFIENIIYFIFNGLIVFALAVNTNFAGKTIQDIAAKDKKTVVSQQQPTARSRSLATADRTSGNATQESIGIQLASSGNTILAASSDAPNPREDNQNGNQKEKQSADKKNQPDDKKNKEGRQFFEKWF